MIARRSKAFPSDHSALAGCELVADEQVVDDPLDLLAVHQVEAAPPALELEEARRLGVDVGEQVVVLVQERVRGIQVLEVLDQVGAVELPAAKIAGQQRGPGAAEHAAGVAHRVVAVVAGPVRHRRAVDHDRARRTSGSSAPSIIAAQPPWQLPIDHRLARCGMQLAHDAHELGLGPRDVGSVCPGSARERRSRSRPGGPP